MTQRNNMNLQQVEVSSMPAQLDSPTKLFEIGFQQLVQHCSRPYLNSERPTLIEWERSFLNGGGSDPLRYIYIFKNNGAPNFKIPRHWHYVGFGLSDIHGYKWFCQLHEEFRSSNEKYANSTQPLPELYPEPGNFKSNGFRFELTFRLKCDSEEEWNQEPPAWPRKIMQDLARYVFQTRNTFNVGDYAAWHSPLDSDGQDGESSRLKHLLMTLDPQLREFTPQIGSIALGSITFIQMVGVCDEELQAAREWNIEGILEIMREKEETGGPFLITDMRRGETIFESDPDNSDRVDSGICMTGSNLAKVTVKHKWSYTKPIWFNETKDQQSHDAFSYDDTAKNDDTPSDYPARTPSRMSQGSESAMKLENIDLSDIRYYQSIYILLSEESARMLLIMLKGRLAHKKPFHFQSYRGDSIITYLPEGCPVPSLVNQDTPFAKQGSWLQIYVSNNLREQMWESMKTDFSKSDRSQNNDFEHGLRLPKSYSWPNFDLHLTVVREL